jgi:hypothetical protein
MAPEDIQAGERAEVAEIPPPKRRRFTFVELMVLIAVGGIFFTLLVPVRLRLVEDARRTSCAGNMHQIGMAMSSYAGDYKEDFPCLRSKSMTAAMAPGEGTRSLALLYPNYIDNSKTFSCPSKSSDYRNFELPGFAALPNGDPRLKWATSYWYDYRHVDGQLSTIVIAGDAASDTGWSPTASRGYYRPVSHHRAGGNFMFIGARCMWITCVRGGTAMTGDAVTDPNVYTRDPAQAQHDTCLVN